jgi:O-antigen ligase
VNAIGSKPTASIMWRVLAPADGGVGIARALLIGIMVAALVSTSATVVIEIAAFFPFMVSRELHRRLVQAFHHPLVVSGLPFAAVVVLATFHGPASWHDALDSLGGWRRVALVPMSVAVFDDAASKRLVCKVLVITCLLGALVSFATQWEQIPILNKLPPGVAFHNYTVQGLSFSLAMIVCIAAIMRPDAFASDRLLGDRRIMAAAVAVLAFDVVFVLWGRSGYLALVIMAVAVVTFLARGSWRTKALAGFAVLLCVGLLLASNAQVRGRIGQALHEFETADQSATPTSLGYRAVFWPTTLRMVRDHPIFGVGTGGFADGYRPYGQGVEGWRGNDTGDPHNQFLKILGEQGLIGLAAFLFFIFRALTCPAPTPYRQLAVAALICWCATSLANSHFSTFVEGRLIFFWLGAMLATPLNGIDPGGRTLNE